MQRRIVVSLLLIGAAAGILLIVFLLNRQPPVPDRPVVVEGPRRTPAVTVGELRAVRQSGTLRGKVVDAFTRKPIAGATVIALAPYLETDVGDKAPLWGEMKEKARVSTDAKGTFAIEDLPPDYYNLWVERRGYSWTSVPRAKFKKTHVIELYPPCSIRGKVVYPDGTPAAGVRLQYTPQGTHSEVFSRYKLKDYYGKTRRDGTFRYDGLRPGKFTVEVYPDHHLPAPWTHEPPLEPGENRDLGTHKLDDGFGLTVWVKAIGTGKPVPGIEVKALPIEDPMPRTRLGRKDTTNDKGYVHFRGLGGQVLEKPRFLVVAHVDGVPVMPEAGGFVDPEGEVTIYVRQASVIKGKVLRPNGLPLEMFWVELKPKKFIARQLRWRGENGVFTLYQVPEGNYDLTVRYGNLVDQTVSVTAVAGVDADVGTITLQEGAEIYGTVRHSAGHELEGMVRVHLARKVLDNLGRDSFEPVARAYVRKDGGYQIKGVPEGRFLLWPEPEEGISHKTDPVPVEIGRGTGAVQRDLILHGVGYVHLRFFDLKDGVEIRAAATAILVKRDGGAETRYFGNRTRFQIGTHDIYIELKNEDGVPQRYKAGTVDIQEGETAGPIELRLFEIRDGG